MRKTTKTILSVAAIIFLMAGIFITASQLVDRVDDNADTQQNQTYRIPDGLKETEESGKTDTDTTSDNSTTNSAKDKNNVSSNTTNTNTTSTNTEKKNEKIYGVADVIEIHTVVENKGKDDVDNKQETTSEYKEKEATVVTDIKTPPAPPKKENTKNKEKVNNETLKADTFVDEKESSAEEIIVETVDKVDEKEISNDLSDLFN